jgi:hypothetical protein
MSSDVSKLLTDTVYGIQKDVVKVALLAAASMVYGAVKDGRAYALIARGGAPVAVLAIGAAFVAAHLLRREHRAGYDRAAADAQLVGSPGLLGANHIALGLTLVAVFFIDQLNLNRWLATHLRQWLSIVLPALRRMLTIGRPPAVVPRRRSPAALRWLVPSTVLLQAWLTVQRIRDARLLREAQLLLEAQRGGFLKQGCRQLLQSFRRWSPLLEKILELAAAIFGTGSAIKYLVRR